MSKELSGAQLQALSEIRGYQSEARQVAADHTIAEADRNARLEMISQEIVVRGGEPLTGIRRAAVDRSAQTRTAAPKKRGSGKRKR